MLKKLLCILLSLMLFLPAAGLAEAAETAEEADGEYTAPDDTTVTLSEKMAELAAELLIETIPGYADGSLVPVPQPEEGACYTGMISKEDGIMDFSMPAA